MRTDSGQENLMNEADAANLTSETGTMLTFKSSRLFAAAAFLVCFGGGALAADPIALRLGDIAQGSNAVPVQVMIDRGIDRQHGLSVEYKTFPTLDGLFTAIRGGGVDVGFGGWTAFAQFRSKGAPITMIFPVARGKALDVLVPTDSPIKSFGELRGKRIGSFAGAAGTGTVLLRVIAAQKYGFDPAKDNNLQFSNATLLLNLIERKELDAVLLFDPIATRALASGKFRSIGNLADVYTESFNEEFLWIGYAMSDAFIAKHPDAASRFNEAWVDAIEYVRAHPEVFDAYGKAFGLDKAGIELLRSRIVGDYTLVWNDKYIAEMNSFARRAREVIGPGFLDEVPNSTFTTKFNPRKAQ